MIRLPDTIFAILAILCFPSFSGGEQKDQPERSSRVLRFDGSTGVMPLVEAVLESYGPPTIVGEGMKTSARIDALVADEIDIAMASHGIDVERFEKENLTVHLFAKMAVVFAVNDSVPVRNLNDQQLCDIYAGRITNWIELGGPDLEIVPLARPAEEVDFEVVSEQIKGFAEVRFADTVRLYATSGELAKALATTSGAIGMTTVVRVSQDEAIESVALNGVFPSIKNMQSGDYTLTRNSYLITKQELTPDVHHLLDFFRKDTAAEIMLANDAIPVSKE